MLTVYKLFFKKIKYLLTIGFMVTLWSTSAWSQTDLKIGNAPGTITSSAVFEAASTSKGMLIPRMTTAQMNAISSPANGLMVYNTTDGCIYVYRSSVWLSTCSPTYAMSWGLLGNSSTTVGTNFIGTTDAQGLAFRTNNTEWMRMSTTGSIGLGLTSPSVKLHLDGGTATATYQKFTANATTGQTATDGFDVGIDAAGNGVLKQNEALPIIISTNATERMRILSAGNIGINTTTPSYKLDIDANTGGTGNPLRLQGLQAGSTADSIVSSSSGILRRLSINQILGNAWNITGNASTVDGTNFIGTTDNIPLNLRVNNQKSGRIDHLLGNNTWGYQTGNSFTSGTNNSLFGHQAGMGITTGSFNTYIGNNSGITSTGGSENVGVGCSTLYNNTSGSLNTAIGESALFSSTTGNNNTGLGGYAGYTLTTGSNNTAVGQEALRNATNPWGNAAFGYRALRSTTTGQANVAVGDSALVATTNASNNTALGYRAGMTLTTGSNNTLLGYGANVSSATLTNTTAIGYNATVGASNSLVLGGTGANAVSVGINTTTPQYKLDIDAQTNSAGNPLRLLGLNAGSTADSIISSSSGVLRRLSIAQVLGAGSWTTTGNASTIDGTNFIGTTDNIPLTFRVNNTQSGRIDNTLGNASFGYDAGSFNTSGTYNTFMGHNAGRQTSTAQGNTGVGYIALTYNTTGASNTALGSESLVFNTTGSSNTAIGRYSLRYNTTGTNSTAVGLYALEKNTTGNYNTAIGSLALQSNTTGSFNIAIGNTVLTLNTTGNNNLAQGYQSMYNNTTGSQNTAQGFQSLYANITGNNNVAIGNYSLGYNSTAWGNTALGYRAAYNVTTGGSNVAIGDSSIHTATTGDNNVALGYRAGLTLTTGSQNTFLGATSDVSSATYTNATAVGYGASVTASNKIRLGNSSVTLVETSGSFVTVSDRRLKTNIEDNYIGLNFIKAVRPVKYELKAQKGIVYDGFIAQEIDSILLKQNIKTFSGLARPADTEGYYTVSYATFVVPLVNAVKELDAKSEAAQKENAELRAELERMKAENAALKATTDKNTRDIENIKALLDKKN